MAQFETTHWSIILLAKESGDSERRTKAVEHVAQRYWYPLYSYARRVGYDPQDSSDLVQGFFLHLLRSELLSRADPVFGQFRSFVLTSLRNFIHSERKREHATKRGGGQTLLSIHRDEAENRFANEPRDQRSPDKMFERTWAMNLIEQALRLLEQEFEASGKTRHFKRLESVLLKEEDAKSYSEIATELGATESSIKVAVHRMRQRFREILRGLVASTVATSSEVNVEMKHLMKILQD